MPRPESTVQPELSFCASATTYTNSFGVILIAPSRCSSLRRTASGIPSPELLGLATFSGSDSRTPIQRMLTYQLLTLAAGTKPIHNKTAKSKKIVDDDDETDAAFRKKQQEGEY